MVLKTLARCGAIACIAPVTSPTKHLLRLQMIDQLSQSGSFGKVFKSRRRGSQSCGSRLAQGRRTLRCGSPSRLSRRGSRWSSLSSIIRRPKTQKLSR